MPTLADLLKIKHLIWQTTKIDVKGTLLHVVGEITNINTLEQLQRRKLNVLDLQIIRQLYDSVRRVEMLDGMVEHEASKIKAIMDRREALNVLYVPEVMDKYKDPSQGYVQ